SDVIKIALVVVAVNVAVYGCSRSPAERNANADRIRSLEARCVKLENDFRTVAQARDKARAESARLEEETTRLQKELSERSAVGERDELQGQLGESQAQREELRKALVSRTTERDQLKVRADRLRKGLQTMLSQDEVPGPSATPVAAPAKPAKASAAPTGP